jgi:hypothetical protein
VISRRKGSIYAIQYIIEVKRREEKRSRRKKESKSIVIIFQLT